MVKIGTAAFAAVMTSSALAAAGPAMSWNADEPTHARLLQQGLTGKALQALEGVLVAEGFHVTSVQLQMAGTAVPTLHEGTLTIVYETTVQQPACPNLAPCRHVVPRRTLVQLSCDQSLVAGTKPAPSCDGLRGLSIIPQQ
jgi:hypothetical protein